MNQLAAVARDRVVVLRLGRNVADLETSSASQEQIVAAITGAVL